MPWNLSLLTVLFNVCYFITKGRNVVKYTTITRDYRDYFTNVCENNCIKYGAEHVVDSAHDYCRCGTSNWTRSVFLRFDSANPCKSHDSEQKFVNRKEKCALWAIGGPVVKVIETDTERTELYPFIPFGDKQSPSCTLKPVISYLNATGKWESFNLSGNELEVPKYDGNLARNLQIKVTGGSPSLTKFKGYVMKLGLACTRQGQTIESCLLFKAKGDLPVRFPLNCTSQPPPTTTTAPPTTTTTTPTTRITTTTRISTSTITNPPSSTTPTTTAPPTTTTTPTPKIDDSWKIPVIVVIGIVLCLSLTAPAFVLVLYRYTHMCKPRRNQARNPDNDFDVVANQGPQTYGTQEEPLYVEVTDIYPCDKGSVGASERPSVVLNPYANKAVFSRGRQTTDPLPSRPERDGNFRTAMDAAGPANQNERNSDIDEETDGSIVLKNPKIQEASFSSIPRSENDLTRLPEVHELDHHHHHHHHGRDGINEDTIPLESEETDKDLVYQGLMQKSRTQSVFVCPTCNEDPVYQGLRVPGSCPHAAKDKPKEKTTSFYESLKGLEKGSRESVYASTSHVEKEPLGEEKENRNSGEGLPDYQILEPEETVANEEPDEPANHDYNVLEGPEENCDEGDEYAKDKTPDMDPKSVNPNLPIEPSEFQNMEDNPVYAKPFKARKESDLPNELPEVLNVEDTPNCTKPWKTKEDPDLPIEPSEVLNVEDNPAYAKPCKMKQDTDSPMEPSQFLNIENNPAYTMQLKAEAIQSDIRRKSV